MVPWQKLMRPSISRSAERSPSARPRAWRTVGPTASERGGSSCRALVEAAEGRFTLDLRTEAGTYVKEWVEGDGGRTEPNLASLVGAPLKVEYLDVLEIHDTEA